MIDSVAIEDVKNILNDLVVRELLVDKKIRPPDVVLHQEGLKSSRHSELSVKIRTRYEGTVFPFARNFSSPMASIACRFGSDYQKYVFPAR